MTQAGKTSNMTFTWGSLTFENPYRLIKEIFDYTNMHTYLNFMKRILLHSTSKKKYKIKDAGNMLFLLEGIGSLLQACYVIRKERVHSLPEIWDGDLLNSNFYSVYKDDTDIWSDFPRSLSKAETLDPYASFKHVFKHNKPDKWYKIIKTFIEYACGSYNESPEENVLEVYIQLNRLFEAAHLIYVRELVHTRGWRRLPKNK